ncbi:MAG: hypothetical protein SAL07_22595 [Oscillatoria sp. PMC 1051.18]|nr:hypothetical protein [Oscillatoria sp. PMC 1050.18]MEC5032699.1 hypothetical protein [Oscillatoria sp. PMC 1051.18]
MVKQIRSTIRLGAIASLQVGLLAMAIPNSPTLATDFNQFNVCARELRSVGISPEESSAACAGALKPKDLSICVLRIYERTPILAREALDTCFRVRQPVELSFCVAEISQETKNPNNSQVLENCRLSLIPKRFSQCVVGLTREIDLSPAAAMENCIDAEDFPRELFPTFE